MLASDMDGTLLNSQSELSIENINAIKGMVERGSYFVLSTGRPYQAVTKYVKQLGLERMPLILYNGAMVVYDGEVILNLTLPNECVKEIAEIGHSQNSTMICWSEGRLFAEHSGKKLDQYKKISDVQPEIIPDLSVLKNVTKFVWYDSVKETADNFKVLAERFKGVVNVHPSRIDFLEFVNKDCSKSNALAIIADKMGVDRQDIIAVGDGYNDLPMLNWAGLGVTVQNAPDGVKEQVSSIAPSNDENAVKWLIDRYFNEN